MPYYLGAKKSLRFPRKKAAAPFTPTDIVGLNLWFDATRIVGLVDADPVSTWIDSSGNAHDVTGAGAARPTYKTGIQNGLPIVRFNGVANVLNRAAQASMDISPVTVFCVYKNYLAGVFNSPIRHGVLGVRNNYGVLSIGGGNPNQYFQWNAGESVAFANAQEDLWFIRTDKHTGGAPATVTIRNNGVAIGSLGGNTALDTDVTDQLYLGQYTAALFGTVDIAELIVYAAALSAADITTVETYLNTKWAIY